MSLITLQCLEPKKNEHLHEFDALVKDIEQLDGTCALQAMWMVTAAFHLNLVEELMKEHLVLLSFEVLTSMTIIHCFVPFVFN